MGAAASIQLKLLNKDEEKDEEKEDKQIVINLRKLPEAIEESLFIHEKFVLIIDETEQASRFLKYQMGSFIDSEDPTQFNSNSLNRCLVNALQYGRTLTIKFKNLNEFFFDVFEDKIFPKEILSRKLFYMDEIWKSIIKVYIYIYMYIYIYINIYIYI
jgi:hypothetical protein